MKKILLFLFLAFVMTNIALSQWEPCNNGISTKQFIQDIKYNGNKIFVGTSGDGLLISTDNGDIWTPSKQGLNNPTIWSIAIKDSDIYAGSGSGVYFSSNSGNTWKDLKITGNTVTSIIINGNNISVAAGHDLLLSTDNGYKWKSINPGYFIPLNIVLKDSNIIIGTLVRGMYLSTNLGTDWKSADNGLTNHSDSCIYALGIAGNNIYAGTLGGGVFLSTDFGNSWKSASKGISNYQVYSLITNKTNIYAGTSRGVNLSTDNGFSWKSIGLQNYYIMSLAICGNYIFAGTDGQIDSIEIFRAKLSDLGISDVKESTYQSVNDIEISPNPASDNISISMSGLDGGHLEIYNSLGIELKRFDENEIIGKSSINISTKEFPSGVYYCIMNAGTNKVTKSFVVVK